MKYDQCFYEKYYLVGVVHGQQRLEGFLDIEHRARYIRQT